MSKPAAKAPPPPPPTITPGEMRIELMLDGFRSVVSAGFLTLGQSNARIEALLIRIAEAVENQTKLLTRVNGHARHDAHQNE